MIELLVFRDGREVARYMLGTSGSTLIGRGDDCELLLDDSAVSRKHARIRVESGRVFLSDLGSGNGTWFQGLRVRDMELENGAEFRIEPFDLRIAISATNAQVHAATRPVEASRPGASDPAFGGSVPQDEEPAALFEQPSISVSREPGGAAAMGPRLERCKGGDAPILLTRADVTLGRGDDATFALRDAAISRVHARLTFGTDRFTIEDLRSANGTFVNGERITAPRLLKDGDRLKMGDTELLFVDPSAGTVSAVDAAVPTKPVPLDEEERLPPRASLRAEPSPQPQARRSVTPHPRRPTPPPRERFAEIEAPGEPIDPPERTEAGLPPPSAFLEPEMGIEMPPPVFDETESGGLAMELDPLEPAARGERKRTIIAAAVSLGLVLFLAVVAVRPSGPKAADPLGPDPEPNRMQNTMLMSLERLTREADEALAKDPKDFAFAIDRYQRISAAARNPELDAFRRVRELRVMAPQMVTRLHEAMMVKALRDETERRAIGQEDLRKKVAALLAAATEGIAAGKRGSLDGYDRALKALADVVALVPGHPEAMKLTVAVRPERDELARKYASASREKVDRECKHLYDLAAPKLATRNSGSLQAAIATLDEILETDPSGLTSWPARARAERAKAVAKLGELASPLRESARRSNASQDWKAARKFLRSAVAMNPYDPQLREELAAAQAECERAAGHHMKLAKAYDEARNDSEALKECALVKTFADRSTDKLWRQATDLEKKIRTANER